MRVDADDFARPCGDGNMHHTEVKEVLIEPGAVNMLEEAMSEGFLKEYISPLLICDTNTCKATEELMEDIFDRCQVLVLDAEELQADQHAVEIVENYMDEDIDLILAVGSGTIHDISRYVAFQYKLPFISVPTAASTDGFVSEAANMVWNGQEKRIPAEPPVAIYADTDIFANAPAALNIAGMACLNGSDLQPSDIQRAEQLIEQGDAETCEKLMYALIKCGIASQAEQR
ncbi:iron-containing alcohol dehydrogenase [Blautia sp. MSJ-19]|uniref:iron-containing alcohol dehydrogenase n=1 Tax=Blautia sp. MSJ-19 TaxID=2841517 RepID=UPI001C0EF783|nr:iron-containing alcohol dehydrogenase [Blautia sp. MSJ-19]MBU5479941.1 iron-containing alcohol dehydrogenase [Blautia sp. MSJ-19]